MMKFANIIFASKFLLLVPTLLQAQTARPADHGNKIVYKGQLSTTSKTLRHLEAGNLDSVLFFIDTVISNKPLVIADLKTSMTEIKKYKAKTIVSEGLVVYENNHNVYRCIYYIEDTGEHKFLIDLHYAEGHPESKIVMVKIKLKRQLDKERRELIKLNKKSSNTPPPGLPSN